MHKIALDAGHGLNTPGKQTPDGIKEWTLNDRVRDKVVAFLADYDVEFIHTDGNEGLTDEGLTARLSMYKKAGVEAFVSIHHNALTGNWNNATGVEVFTDKNPTEEDIKLAQAVYKRLVEYTGLAPRGIKRANFAVINQNSIPAILIEGGFMDGTSDYKYITSDEGQTAYAKAVAEGLIEFLGLQKKTYGFIDTKGHYAEKHINKLVGCGVVKGYEDNTFRPNNNITRAEFSTLVVNVLEKICGYKLNITKVFPDTIGHWAENHIRKLTDAGIISGFEDGMFKPDNTITRGQAAIIACNMLLYCGAQIKTGNIFPDIIGHYAERHISSLEAYGIVNGYEDGTFKPENNITRGQAAMIISNCLVVLGK